MNWRKRERHRSGVPDECRRDPRDDLRIRSLFDDPEIQRLLLATPAHSVVAVPSLPVRIVPAQATHRELRVDNDPEVVTAFTRLALAGRAIEAVRQCRVVESTDVLGDVA